MKLSETRICNRKLEIIFRSTIWLNKVGRKFSLGFSPLDVGSSQAWYNNKCKVKTSMYK